MKLSEKVFACFVAMNILIFTYYVIANQASYGFLFNLWYIVKTVAVALGISIIAVILLIRKIKWGWLVAALPALWYLFYPGTQAGGYSISPIFALFQAIAVQDFIIVNHRIMMILLMGFIPFFYIMNFFGTRNEKVYSWIFAGVACFLMTDLPSMIFHGFYLRRSIEAIIFVIIYIGSLIFWEHIEKDKKK
ncbi:MAG: hypothetical protein KJ601_00115 [Nanoarchaeota archaeon]|nr:hypothetical protein [Nanoarchaeota archaeon]MBU1703863.1 hypothetical protein [Nanoarchaeota archaeon]